MYDKEKLAELDRKYLMHPVMHPRHYDEIHSPRIIVEADGVILKDADGREVIDGFSGLWCVAIGHNNPKVVEAVNEQMKKLCFFSSFHGMSTPPSINLAEKLVGMLDPSYNLNRVWFTCGGSESNESNIKVARLYWALKGREEKQKIISRRHSYHGMGLATTAATGIAPFHEHMGPLPSGFIKVAAPYCYQCEFDKTYPGCNLECVQHVEKTIEKEGPETVAAFIAEPVIGAGGVVPPPPEYYPRLREICDKYEILLILDEVITGFGRTGKMFGHNHWGGIRPDMISMAKCISSGYIPLGAAVVRGDIYDTVGDMQDISTPLMHGFTYMNHPVSCAAGIANIEVIEEEKLVEKAAVNGEYMIESLMELKRHECVGDIRGMGMMAAVEMAPEFLMDGNTPAVRKIVDHCWENGLYIRSSTKATVSLAPPLIMERSTIDRMVETLHEAIRKIEIR